MSIEFGELQLGDAAAAVTDEVTMGRLRRRRGERDPLWNAARDDRGGRSVARGWGATTDFDGGVLVRPSWDAREPFDAIGELSGADALRLFTEWPTVVSRR